MHLDAKPLIKIFSSITVLHKYDRRYAHSRFYNKWKRPVIVGNEKILELINQSSKKITIKDLFLSNNLPYRVTRDKSNTVYFLPNHYMNYINESRDIYLIGLRGLIKDNLDIRVIEQLAYWVGAYEAIESAKAKSLFYNLWPKKDFYNHLYKQNHPYYGTLKEVWLDELNESGNKVLVQYYKYQPK